MWCALCRYIIGGYFLQMEQFKDVVGWENQYEVSNLGTVRTKERLHVFDERQGCRTMLVEGKIKSMSKNNGYWRVTLYSGLVKKHMTVHRLVAQAFIPNPDNKPCINHISGIKTDNRVENLEWVTYKENSEHAIANGLIGVRGVSTKPRARGYKHRTIICDICNREVSIGSLGRHKEKCTLYNPYQTLKKGQNIDPVVVKKMLSEGNTYSDICRKLELPYMNVWISVNGRQ